MLWGVRGIKEGVMRTPEKTTDQKNRPGRNYTSIFFNLLALAILLTAIVVLHQILKKPKSAEVKSVAALSQTEQQKETAKTAPAQPTATTQAKEPVAVVELEQKTEDKKPAEEPEKETVTFKEVKTKPSVGKRISKRNEWKSPYADEGPPVEELDNESARQKYLNQNQRLSKGIDTAPAPRSSSKTYEATEYDRRYTSGKTSQPAYYGSDSANDLDSEAARRHYLDENKRLSRELAYDPSKSRTSPNPESSNAYRNSGEYIPFESK